MAEAKPGLGRRRGWHNATVGTDITFVVERRAPDGRWARAETMIEAGVDEGHVRPERESWYDSRNYELFELLAGVLCPRPLQPRTVIAEPRGLPIDVGDETLRDFSEFSDDCFSPSWLDAHDLVTFDWQQTLESSFFLTPPHTLSNVSEDDWEKAKACVAEWGIPPIGWGRAGWSAHDVRVTGRRQCWSFATEFLSVIMRMVALAPGDLHAVRCVFWFDR